MFKLLVLLSFLQWSNLPFNHPKTPAASLCPEVSNLQKTAQTANSLTFAWTEPTPNVQYRVWFIRHENSAFSGYFYTSNPSYCFSGLSAGTYTFYVQVMCGQEASEYIGIEDCIPA